MKPFVCIPLLFFGCFSLWWGFDLDCIGVLGIYLIMLSIMFAIVLKEEK